MLPFRPSVNRGNFDGITNVEIELNYTVIKTNTRLGTTIKKELLPRLLGNSNKRKRSTRLQDWADWAR